MLRLREFSLFSLHVFLIEGFKRLGVVVLGEALGTHRFFCGSRKNPLGECLKIPGFIVVNHNHTGHGLDFSILVLRNNSQCLGEQVSTSSGARHVLPRVLDETYLTCGVFVSL